MESARDSALTIVGGGIIGCAVAYALAEAGYRNIQVLERSQICGETSSRAAGLVGQVRTSVERTRVAMASVAMFQSLEKKTGVTPDWVQSGSLRLALTPERVVEFDQMARVAGAAGLEVARLSAGEVAEMIPLAQPEAVLAALWCPTDGYLQPNSLAMSYVAGARRLGVRFVTNCEVMGFGVRDGAVRSVMTKEGEFATELVINAAGPWAGWVARMVGLELPIVPVRHEYFITGATEGYDAGVPVLRVPDERIYIRPELDGLLCGGWEAQALSMTPKEVDGGSRMNPEADWEVMGEFANSLTTLFSGVSEAGVRSTVGGFPAFTPDGRFVIGEVPGLDGYVMAAGCNAHGVSGSAGIAELVLESLGDDPSPYVTSLSPGRFMEEPIDPDEAQRQAQRVYEDYYAVAAAAQGGATDRP
ncbi:FAD-dependent oxidoreductase [Ferrimicrobium sp.]|uniref:NAD(P)/FAD-dependent oxidoreductase n=1 Tax=Ferrimicrobium sp. TaxID=2926050 RepID=UPI00261DDC7B|nr:FAD-dependent oxidoreductase [Ferrimicrobium sp.]